MSKVYHFSLEKSKISTYHQDAFGVARNILLEPSPWPGWSIHGSIFLHDKFPWFSASCWGFFFSRSWKNYVRSSLLQIIATKNSYMFFSACHASTRPVGMADFCCPAVELLKWSSQPDCCGTQHWVWLGKVLADLPNFSHLTLAGMYVIHLLPYTVDGPNPADVDNMSTGCFGINCPASFFLTGLHYVLLRGFWTSSQYGIKMMDVFNLFVAMSKWNIIHKACKWSLPSRNHFLRIHSSHLFFGNLYPSLTPPGFDNVEVLWSGEAFLILGGSMLIHSWWEWCYKNWAEK